jgi:putative colanic acid biosynthesis acetyltransferase WcaF
MQEKLMRDLSKFSGEGYDKGRSAGWQIAWLVVQSLVFKRWWMPASARVRILRAFGAEIGHGVLIRDGVTIHWPWKLAIGDHSWIGVGAWILNLEPVRIGCNTCISQQVLLCTGSHQHDSPSFEFDNAPIEIGDHVWVAVRATVLRGVHIADGALIGACALVTRDVGANERVLASTDGSSSRS